MSVSARTYLIPGLALATAGAVALTPAMSSAPMAAPALPATAVPSIHIEEIQLAGIGREIYDSITNFVQYTVSSAEFWIDLIPLIGPPLADQLNINYFDGIQPIVAATVYFLSDVIDNPFNFLTLAVDYGSNLFYTGYNWLSAQAEFFGLPPFTPIPVPPPLAAELPGGRGAAAAVEAPTAPAIPATEVSESPAADSPETPAEPESEESVTVVRPDARAQAARSNAETPRPGRAESRVVAGSAATETSTPEAATPETQSAQAATDSGRDSAKATRGAARTSR